MGDSEEYTSAEQSGADRPADPQEPVAPAPPEHDYAAGDPLAAIQAELLMEEPDEPGAPVGIEAPEIGSDVEQAPAAPHEAPIEPLSDGSASPEASEPEPDAEPAVAVEQLDAEPDLAAAPFVGDAVTDDDLAAAVAASTESVGDAEIIETPTAVVDAETPAEAAVAPAPPVSAQPVEAAEIPGAIYGAPWWPYLVYFGLWVAVAAVGVWQFKTMPAGEPIYEAIFYRYFLFAGLVLSALGPVLVLGVWLVCRESDRRQRKGLFTSALLKGAFFTLLGVIVWWGTLLAVDFIRFGRFF